MSSGFSARQRNITQKTWNNRINRNEIGDLIISRNSEVNWPPRSCDWTSLEYFLWGYLKVKVYEAFHVKSDGLKNVNFWFPSFFWHFLVSIKKLFLVNFEIFLITGIKEIEFRFFAHNFFNNGPNSNFFFTYFLEKNTKKWFKVFLYVIFEFENFTLVFETVPMYSSIFW